MNDEEKVIRLRIIADLDKFFEDSVDVNFNNLKEDNEDYTDEECAKIESMFMAFRNVIAGTEIDESIQQEYEKYQVRK